MEANDSKGSGGMSGTELLDRIENQPAGDFNVTLDANRIASDTIIKLVAFCGKKIYETVSARYKDHAAKTAIDYGQAFQRYLVAAEEKYSKTKTLLYRKEPKNLYDFYECVGVRYGNRQVSTEQIENLLEIGRNLLITGTGGIGKSTMLKHLFLNAIETTNYIPIFVELRNVNDRDLTISDCIYENLRNLGFGLEREYFEYSLEAGCFVFLFDGYDEVRQSKANQVSAEIKTLCDRYPENYFILSSRPAEAFVGWNSFVELEAMKLSRRQAIRLVSKLDYNPPIKEKFLHALSNGLFEKHRSFASNPLLLTIMLLTFEDHASIPDKLHCFYEQAFVTLFNRHDATKDGYVRDIRSKLPFEDFKRVFAHFCFKSYFKSDYEFREDLLTEYIEMSRDRMNLSGRFSAADYILDLTGSVCMLIQDGFVYRFTHRSFQEYFAALCTMNFPDVIQQPLLTQWLEKNPVNFNSGYVDILFDIEEDRFLRNAIFPFLRRFRGWYEQERRNPYWLLKFIFESASLGYYPSGPDGEEETGIGFTVKDRLYTGAVDFVWDRFYTGPNRVQPVSQEAADYVIDYFEKTYGFDHDVTFEEIEQSEISEDFIRYTACWSIRKFDFAMDFLERYEQETARRDTSLASLIDSL